MAHPFFMGITFPVDMKPGNGEKSLSAGQIRYAIRMNCMYEKKITYLGFTVQEIFKK